MAFDSSSPIAGTALSIDEALARAAMRLQQAGIEAARDEARLLTQHASGLDHAGIIAVGNTPMSASAAHHLDTMIDRRIASEPVHRIIGHRNFHGLDLALSPQTLEPRDDSGALVAATLEQLEGRRGETLRFVDLGTGTGAIALALLAALPNATAVLTDIAEGALATAVANAERHGLADRICARAGDWFSPLEGERFDFLVSNPPYIESAAIAGLENEVRLHDPAIALDGGADGLDVYRVLLGRGAAFLGPGGFLAIETGHDQHPALRDMAKQTGWTVARAHQDLAGRDRALVLTPRARLT